MQRRDLLRGILAGAFAAGARGSSAMTPDEFRQKALANFPFKLIETTGDQALTKWQEPKSSGGGCPVILGGDSFHNLLVPFGPNVPPSLSADAILKLAADVTFPEDLAKRRKADREAATARLMATLGANPNMPLPQITETKNGSTRTLSREETIAAMMQERRDPPVGDWPAAPEPSIGLSVAGNMSGQPLSKVFVSIVPTDDWTTIPAHLRWGNWNDCPAAEYHVAAMRTWRDRYGAELIGMSSDTLNVRVATKPATREEALALAHDQYIYCADIVEQGAQTYSALAAYLMANDWWYFWWD
jgi:hypothetical protein